jgi:hypothetical protein
MVGPEIPSQITPAGSGIDISKPQGPPAGSNIDITKPQQPAAPPFIPSSPGDPDLPFLQWLATSLNMNIDEARRFYDNAPHKADLRYLYERSPKTHHLTPRDLLSVAEIGYNAYAGQERERAMNLAAHAQALASPDSPDFMDAFLPDVFTRADDNDVHKFADEVGKAILGRKLNQKELAKAHSAYRAAERAQYTAKTGAARLSFMRQQMMQKVLDAQQNTASGADLSPEQLGAIARASNPSASQADIDAIVARATAATTAAKETGTAPTVTQQDMDRLNAQLGAGIEIPSIQPGVEQAVEHLAPHEAAGVDFRKAFDGFVAAIQAGKTYGQP